MRTWFIEYRPNLHRERLGRICFLSCIGCTCAEAPKGSLAGQKYGTNRGGPAHDRARRPVCLSQPRWVRHSRSAFMDCPRSLGYFMLPPFAQKECRCPAIHRAKVSIVASVQLDWLNGCFFFVMDAPCRFFAAAGSRRLYPAIVVKCDPYSRCLALFHWAYPATTFRFSVTCDHLLPGSERLAED